jgi:hypothetical protein
MSDQGKANYEAYRELAGRPGVSAAPLPEYEQLPMELASAFDAGAYAVELWLSQAPVDEDAPGNEPQPERDRLLARLDKATRDHADVGLPGEIRRANANRTAAGLEPLPVPGGEITFTPVGYQGPAAHTFTTGCDGFHPVGEQCNLPARDAQAEPASVMHLMTIEMGAWCGASGPASARASSQWREVTCPACTAKGMAGLRSLVWDMLADLPASDAALAFALRAGRLGVTNEQGTPLTAACGVGEDL